MLARRGITKVLLTKHRGGTICNDVIRRWMVTKAANRAAVHGSKLPAPDLIQKGEVEMKISRAVEQKERKRREIERGVDSQLKNWQVLYVEEIVRSYNQNFY